MGELIRDSRYLFPAVESLHLLGLAFLLGSVLLVNLRLLGVAFRRVSPAEAVADFAPWTRLALAVMIVSGALLYLAKGEDIWINDREVFVRKMVLIVASVLFHHLIVVRVARGKRRGLQAVAALAAISMWLGAAWNGLSIEFL